MKDELQNLIYDSINYSHEMKINFKGIQQQVIANTLTFDEYYLQLKQSFFRIWNVCALRRRRESDCDCSKSTTFLL